MATHSSVLAWRIPGTGEPGGLPSMGSHRVGHDRSDLAAAAAARAQFSAMDCWIDITCYLNAVPATEEPRKEGNAQLCVNLLSLQ